MQDNNTLISVIIPCYNYGSYLPAAIRSVLEQTGGNFATEIIVVDDGSSDNTEQAAKSFGQAIRYVSQENQGPSAARNNGIRNATGDFVIFLDADDLLGANVIATHLKNFARDPGLDRSICHCYCISPETGESNLWALKASHLDMHLCYSNIAPIHAFMTRRQTIEDAGLFNQGRAACEDYEYWLRCAKLGKHFAATPDAFVVYRRHSDSLTGQHLHMLLHDISVRHEVDDLFQPGSNFPKAGAWYGSLAYAAGLLASSMGLSATYPDLALELVNGSAQGLLDGAKFFPKISQDDAYLIRAERYYALEFFINASQYGPDFSPALRKAAAFISARYPNLVRGPMEQLKKSRRSQYMRLLSDHASIKSALKAYKLPDAQ